MRFATSHSDVLSLCAVDDKPCRQMPQQQLRTWSMNEKPPAQHIGSGLVASIGHNQEVILFASR